jgi:hypothetical protein
MLYAPLGAGAVSFPALASLRHWTAVMPMVLFERALKGGPDW